MLKKLLLTGYKNFELGIFDNEKEEVKIIKKAIENRLRPMVDEGLELVCITGQLGVELWGAEVVLELKEEFPYLKLAVITPFLHHSDRWKDETRNYYQGIVSRADIFKSTSDKGYESPDQFKRHNHIVIKSTDGALMVYDEEKKASPRFLKETIEYQTKHRDYEVTMIDFFELEETAEEVAEQRREEWGFE